MAFFAQVPQSPGSRLAEQLGLSVGQGIEKRMLQGQQQQQQGVLARLLQGNQLSGQEMQSLPMEAQIKVAQLQLAQQQASQKQAIQQERSRLIQGLFGIGSSENITEPGIQSGNIESGQTIPQTGTPSITDSQIAAVGLYDPQLARVLQSQQKEKTRVSQAERSYQTQFSKELEKKAEGMRESLPRKESALDFARNAVESGEVGAFSKNRLADAIGGPIGDALRTAKGAELVTASKENLLSNMSRASARAQNLWFEQRLNSMFPKMGQTQEANLTTQEMLESELAMEQAYLDSFDKLAEQDQKKFGYVRKDIGKRAENEVKTSRNEIFDRAVYRMRNIEERERGLSEMKSQVGKKVIRGTPLTIAMAKLYKDKFGDQALKIAKENGYKIPTIEEFQKYQLDPREFRQQFSK